MTKDRNRPLRPRQAIFARQFALHGNASKAAREAKYGAIDGQRLKKLPHVVAEVERIKAQVSAEAALSVNKVIGELGLIAFANILDYINPATGEVNIATIDRQKAAPIVEYSVTTTKAGTTTKLKLADKLGGLDRLARHVGAYEVDNTQKLATPAKLDERQARDLARRVAFMMRSDSAIPASVTSVVEGEFSPVEPLSISDKAHNSH